MSKKKTAVCCNCRKKFTLDKRNYVKQRYCNASECRKASKKYSQKKWLKKNSNYFKGKENIKRVQDWRARNPKYWKRKNKNNIIHNKKEKAKREQKDISNIDNKSNNALQDILNSQNTKISKDTNKKDKKKTEVVEIANTNNKSNDALQDIMFTENYLITGILAVLSGNALQDSIEKIKKKFINLGKNILENQKLKKEEIINV